MIRFVNLLAALILQMFFMALQRVKKVSTDKDKRIRERRIVASLAFMVQMMSENDLSADGKYWNMIPT
jgi:hypothetical protein